mmetsp:Transcript_8324/g.7371  ORF Transcript_8324/g.7371 Transcript_8324/m.7371 type:complete len:196 (+) Transcript_8324:509-1096(+)
MKGHIRRSTDTGYNDSHTYFVNQLIKSPRHVKVESVGSKNNLGKFRPYTGKYNTHRNLPPKVKESIVIEDFENSKEISHENLTSLKNFGGFRKSQSVMSLASIHTNQDLANLKTNHKIVKSRFATQRGSEVSSEFRASNLNTQIPCQINGLDTIPRVMALKAAKYKKFFKQPNSIDYQAYMRKDPTKNNNRFINT